ncbi:hypothetical protein J6590_023014 [Homalodisca vitripennis]|nr:hypothetical protein J6590_023014 [Homalodisca vitripennis]
MARKDCRLDLFARAATDGFQDAKPLDILGFISSQKRRDRWTAPNTPQEGSILPGTFPKNAASEDSHHVGFYNKKIFINPTVLVASTTITLECPYPGRDCSKRYQVTARSVEKGLKVKVRVIQADWE